MPAALPQILRNTYLDPNFIPPMPSVPYTPPEEGGDTAEVNNQLLPTIDNTPVPVQPVQEYQEINTSDTVGNMPGFASLGQVVGTLGSSLPKPNFLNDVKDAGKQAIQFVNPNAFRPLPSVADPNNPTPEEDAYRKQWWDNQLNSMFGAVGGDVANVGGKAINRTAQEIAEEVSAGKIKRGVKSGEVTLGRDLQKTEASTAAGEYGTTWAGGKVNQATRGKAIVAENVATQNADLFPTHDVLPTPTSGQLSAAEMEIIGDMHAAGASEQDIVQAIDQHRATINPVEDISTALTREPPIEGEVTLGRNVGKSPPGWESVSGLTSGVGPTETPATATSGMASDAGTTSPAATPQTPAATTTPTAKPPTGYLTPPVQPGYVSASKPPPPPPPPAPPSPPTGGPPPSIPTTPANATPGKSGVGIARLLAEAAVTHPGSSPLVAPSLATKALGIINPSVAMPRAASVANKARSGVRASEYTRMRDQLPVAKDFVRAYEAAQPIYIGRPNNPAANTWVDFAEHPWDYQIPHTAVKMVDDARAAYDQIMDDALIRSIEGYSVEIKPTAPVGPNGERGSYVPHMQTEEAQKALSTGSSGFTNTGKVSIQKERGYESIGERMERDKYFDPELDPLKLIDAHSRQLAEAMARNTYTDIIGGMSRVEVIDLLHPGVKKARDQLANKVQNLRNTIEAAETRIATQSGIRAVAEKEAAAISNRLVPRMSELSMATGATDAPVLRGRIQEAWKQAKGLEQAIQSSATKTGNITAEQQAHLAEANALHQELANKDVEFVNLKAKIGAKAAVTEMGHEMDLLDNRLQRAINSADKSQYSLDAQTSVKSELDKQRQKINSRISEMTEDLDSTPEITSLRSAINELKQRATSINRVLNATDDKEMKNLLKIQKTQTELNKAKINLEAARARYKTTSTGNYVVDPITGKYTTPELAKASKNVSRTLGDDRLDSIIKLAEETRAVSLGMGDLSPITFGQGILTAASHPDVLALNAVKIVRAIMDTNESHIWDNVDQNHLRIYEQLQGYSVLHGGGFSELRTTGKGAERLVDVGSGPLTAPIRGVGQLIRGSNEMSNRLVELLKFKAWEHDVWLAQHLNPGASVQDVAAGALESVNTIAPGMNFANSGYSSALSRTVGAPFTSLSFALSPVRLVRDFTLGIAELSKNIATSADPIGSWQKLSVAKQINMLRGLSMIATLSVISAASAYGFDDRADRSPGEKMLDAINPMSNQWWTLHTPIGGIPIGGPFRSFGRFVGKTGKEVMDNGHPTGGAATQYGRGRLMTMPSTTLDYLINKDYQGNKIMHGEDDTERVKQALMYGLEHINLVTGAPLAEMRTHPGAGVGGLVGQFLSSMGGFNLYETSPTQDVTNTLMRDTIPKLKADGTLPPNVTSMDQLGSGEANMVRNQFAKDHPDIKQDSEEWKRLFNSVFQRAEDSRQREEADAKPQLDDIYSGLLGGKYTPSDAKDKLKHAVIAYQKGISDIYDTQEYKDAVKELPQNKMRQNETQYFNITKDYLAKVAPKDKNGNPSSYYEPSSDDWDAITKQQDTFIANLSRDEGKEFADRFQKNLEERRSIVDAHPLIKLKRQIDDDSKDFYNIPVLSDNSAREDYLRKNPNVDVERWLMYSDKGYVHSPQAVDMLMSKQWQAGGPVGEALTQSKQPIRVSFNTPDGSSIDFAHRVDSDPQAWNRDKSQLKYYADLTSDQKKSAVKDYPSVHAALVYWGHGESIKDAQGWQQFDNSMKARNWEAWPTISPYIDYYLATPSSSTKLVDKKELVNTTPYIDAFVNMWHEYMFGTTPEFHSQAGKDYFHKVTGRDVSQFNVKPAPKSTVEEE